MSMQGLSPVYYDPRVGFRCDRHERTLAWDSACPTCKEDALTRELTKLKAELALDDELRANPHYKAR